MGENKSTNGEKSKIIWFLLALLQAIVFGMGYKIFASLEDNSGVIARNSIRISILESNYDNIKEQLGDIKKMIRKKQNLDE